MKHTSRPHLLFLPLSLCLASACGDKPDDGDDDEEEPRIEGTEPGDCTDGADNDGDGDFDCEDAGCAGSPDCAEDSGESNRAPELTVALSSASPMTDDTLTAVVTAEDPDGDAVQLAYTWTVDGAEADEDGDTLDGSVHFDKGQVVAVTVVASDGELETTATSDEALVANSPPSAPTLSITPAVPWHDDDLICTADTDASDPDGDLVVTTATWLVDGVPFGDTTTTTFTGDTVEAEHTSGGESWTCVAAASDGESSSPEATATTTICESDLPALEVGPGAVATAPASATWALGDQLSVEFWARFDSASSDYNHMSVSTELNDTTGWHCTYEALQPRESTARFFMDPAYSTRPGTRLSVDLAPITDGAWHHFACQYDGTTMRLFLDGVEQASAAHSGNVEYTNGPLYLLFRNRYWSTGTQDYAVREVRIGDEALYSADFTPDWMLPATTGTVALYRMDEGAGDTLVDSVGGLDATASGTTWGVTDHCP